jgi:hypothetical protein
MPARASNLVCCHPDLRTHCDRLPALVVSSLSLLFLGSSRRPRDVDPRPVSAASTDNTDHRQPRQLHTEPPLAHLPTFSPRLNNTRRRCRCSTLEHRGMAGEGSSSLCRLAGLVSTPPRPPTASLEILISLNFWLTICRSAGTPSPSTSSHTSTASFSVPDRARRITRATFRGRIGC